MVCFKYYKSKLLILTYGIDLISDWCKRCFMYLFVYLVTLLLSHLTCESLSFYLGYFINLIFLNIYQINTYLFFKTSGTYEYIMKTTSVYQKVILFPLYYCGNVVINHVNIHLNLLLHPLFSSILLCLSFSYYHTGLIRMIF